MDKSVYPPSEDSYLIKESIEKYLKAASVKKALDMGCGSGILSVALGNQGCDTLAVDINPKALEATLAHASLEGVDDKIKVLESDLFSNIDEKFDLIVFNTPYVPTDDSETDDLESRAWDGGHDGLSVTRKFLKEAPVCLNRGGKIIILVATNDDKEPSFEGFEQSVLGKKSYFFERLWVLLLTPLQLRR